MGKLTERHKPIEEFFYSEKGGYLQWLDSQIAEAILLYFSDNFDQPCLPVHDSFIVDVRFSSFLRDIMHSYFEHALQQKIIVKSDFNEIAKRWDEVSRLVKKEWGKFRDSFLEDLKDYPKNKDKKDKIDAWLREAQRVLDNIEGKKPE